MVTARNEMKRSEMDRKLRFFHLPLDRKRQTNMYCTYINNKTETKRNKTIIKCVYS